MPCPTCQGMVEASNCGGSDASLLVQQLDGRLASTDSLRMSARVRLDVITSVDMALCDLGTFAFVDSHLSPRAGGNSQLLLISSASLIVWRSSTPRCRRLFHPLT